jgi:predicted ATP-dependent endonuclease of OLD family
MKFKKVSIPRLHHFKNLVLDLTYPKGHLKAGQPLDRICIIGQSGTGKTNLLKLLAIESFRASRYTDIITSISILKNISVEFSFGEYEIVKNIDLEEKKEGETEDEVSNYWDKIIKSGKKVSFEEAVEVWTKYIEDNVPNLIYFPAELNYAIDKYNSESTLKGKSIIDFSIENAANSWNLILSDIQKYQEEELKIRQEISKIAEHSKDIKEIQKAVKKLENWRKKNFNPIEDVAKNCLDPLLKNFGLRVKTNLEFQTKEDIGFIKIEDLNGNEIPNGLLSTGTKQALLSALPLYFLKPSNALILYDEPERSLFPDIQRFIIDYYLSLTNNCQFIFATHSPIIASSFDPWEIVELKFDKDWNVYRDLYYEGENHIDNYYLHPKFLDFDLILKKIFDLPDTNTDQRTAAIVEATMFKNQLDSLKKENRLNTKMAKEILQKYKVLTSKLAWSLE